MTEKEMLLLSNYVYMDISTQKMSIGESIDRFRNKEGSFDEKSVANIGIGGGMDAGEAADLLKRIDEMPEDFKKLYPSEILDDEEVRGVCYTKGKSDTGEACVVFRGTGGTYEAWHDNVLGQCMTDTKIQMKAADWVDSKCALYGNVQICGHSKGGNLAMYTTVVSSAAITACVSFDGQGFSQDFIDAYTDEIAKASGKIKSICAHNDFVNILLNSIAGETVYTQNQGHGINAHSSYYMLISNEYGENGQLISMQNQSVLSKALGELTEGVASRLNMLPGSGNRDFTGLLATLVAGIISSDRSDVYERNRMITSTAEVGDYLCAGENHSTFPALCAVRLSAMLNETSCEGLDGCSDEISSLGGCMSSMITELEDFMVKPDIGNKIDCYIKTRIDGIKKRLEENVRNLEDYSVTLKDISRMYAGSEIKVGGYMA